MILMRQPVLYGLGAVCSALMALVPWAHAAERLLHEPIQPVPLEQRLSAEKVALGDRLFHDPRLSSDDSISCADCHVLVKGGVDLKTRSTGVDGQLGTINTPTVFNAGYNLAQFWDGRVDTLEQQVAGPVHNPIEMASDWQQVIDKLGRDPAYRKAFAAIYADGLTADNIQDAIATFERSLVTVDSPFDRWLRGDEAALDDNQKRGYRLFKNYGCIACHQGVNVGGNMYQQMGVMGDYFADREAQVTEQDYGRFNVTGDEIDRYSFKVPSLRLAARTAPYFHDASTDSLDRAIQVMAKYQLGRNIPADERRAIAAFSESLQGRHPRLADR